MSEESDVGAVDVAGGEKLDIADSLGTTLNLQPFLDLLEFSGNPGAVGITFAVCQDQNALAFFPAVFSGEPTWRFRKDDHAEEKDDSGDHLQSPWDSERGSGALDERTTIGDVDCSG